MEDGGRRFSVDVISERSNYDFDIKEVSASLWAPPTALPSQPEWDDSMEGRQTQTAVLELAAAYVNSPLEIVSVQASGPSGKSLVMRGDGLEVVARPGESSSGSAGVHLVFTASARQ